MACLSIPLGASLGAGGRFGRKSCTPAQIPLFDPACLPERPALHHIMMAASSRRFKQNRQGGGRLS